MQPGEHPGQGQVGHVRVVGGGEVGVDPDISPGPVPVRGLATVSSTVSFPGAVVEAENVVITGIIFRLLNVSSQASRDYEDRDN